MKTAGVLLCLSCMIAALSCGPAAYIQSEYDTSNEQHDIGYSSISEKNLAGSANKVKISQNPAIYTNIYDYLIGTVPGLEVNGSSITIRGVQSLTSSNAPLMIVDGIEVKDISDISPSMVDYVEVLKDAIYTAAYGSRGANGVIIIHLKK